MAFAGLEAFDKSFCKLMSNQPINSITDYPKVMLRSFKSAARNRVNNSPELMRKHPELAADVADDGRSTSYGYGKALKSMFYKSSTGDLSYGRVAAAGGAGLATTGIAGSYIFGGDD